MGLFSFIKDAGAKIFGIGKTTAEEKADAAIDKVQREALENERVASKMRKVIDKLGLEVENLNISIKGDVATIRGLAANQETREKAILVVGNTSGIAAVDDQMEVKVQEPVATFHTVEKGDTLSKIAKRVYGNAMKYPIIFEANKPMLTHPDKIYPGQVLRLPPLD